MAITMVACCTAGCGGEAWPSVVGMADPQFAGRQSTVETVDVLPVDLQVWTRPGHRRDPDALLRELEPEIGGMLAAQLARRGYQVVAQLDRSGRYTAPDGVVRSAMPQDDLARTSYALSSYGRAQSELDGQLLVPFLPSRLGAATGSDATLYVGGWAFAGKERGSSKAAKVVKTILIVGLIAVVVVAVIAGIKGDGGPAKGIGKVAEGAGRVAVGTARVAGRVVGGLARTTGHVAHTLLREPELFHLTVETIDAFARTGTHVEVYSARPDYYAEGPRDGRSAMMLEMTLIDNRTGRALWHARQRFPASPVRAQEVERAVARLMSSLPAQ